MTESSAKLYFVLTLTLLCFMSRKKINERFQYFSIILNVRGGENIDWLCLSPEDMINEMLELKFPSPVTLARFMKNFEGIAQNSNVDKSRIRRFRFEEFSGQLEKGSFSERPHYNLSVKTSSKVLVSAVVRELSLALYGVKNCKSINVEATHDVASLNQYCLKTETRLLLPATDYYPPSVDVRLSEFLEALEEDEELKKFMSILVCIKE